MASQSQWPQTKRIAIGIAGRIGSGKTTVGRHLESAYGFQYLRYSAVLAEWLGTDSDRRAHLQEIGWEVMSGGMQVELNQRLVKQIKPDCDVVIDGLRDPLDHQTLSDEFRLSYRLIYIDSASQLRFERLKAKGKYADFASFQAADLHPVEQQIDVLRSETSLIISNDASISTLLARADEMIAHLREGRPS